VYVSRCVYHLLSYYYTPDYRVLYILLYVCMYMILPPTSELDTKIWFVILNFGCGLYIFLLSLSHSDCALFLHFDSLIFFLYIYLPLLCCFLCTQGLLLFLDVCTTCFHVLVHLTTDFYT